MRRFVLLLLPLLSCADGGTGFYPGQSSWAVEPIEVSFDGVSWGENVFAEIGVNNLGEREVVLSLHWAEDSDEELRVMQDLLAISPQSSGTIGLGFFTVAEELEFAGTLLVSEERTGLAVSIEVSAFVEPDEDGDGHVSVNLGGDDCNDQSAAVSPSAEEIWYDGVDQDCDGSSDFDADRDGYDRQPEGMDCDDVDERIHPSAADGLESLQGVDDNCNGFVDEEAVVVGELLITELFVGNNPGPSSFVEIQNVSRRAIDLEGWSVEVNGAVADLSGHGELLPDELVVVCRNAAWARDWSCAGEWGGEQPLGVAGGTAVVVSPALVVDQVDWTKEWGLVVLNGLQRSSDFKTPSGSTDPESWCLSDQSLPSGGLGSPGVENGTCGPAL